MGSQPAVAALAWVVTNGSARAQEDAVMSLMLIAHAHPAKCREIYTAEGMLQGLQGLQAHGAPRVQAKAGALVDFLFQRMKEAGELDKG